MAHSTASHKNGLGFKCLYTEYTAPNAGRAIYIRLPACHIHTTVTFAHKLLCSCLHVRAARARSKRSWTAAKAAAAAAATGPRWHKHTLYFSFVVCCLRCIYTYAKHAKANTRATRCYAPSTCTFPSTSTSSCVCIMPPPPLLLLLALARKRARRKVSALEQGIVSLTQAARSCPLLYSQCNSERHAPDLAAYEAG